MTRERQRQIGLLKATTSRNIKAGVTTLSSTTFVSADTLELFERQGGELFKDYPAKTRRRMARTGAALPDGSFPIGTCSDAEDAIRAQGRAKPEKRPKVRAHIRKRVRALRCSGEIFKPYQD
jgi:hypothetical protein